MTSGSGRISRSFGNVDKIHMTDCTTGLYFLPVHGVATCFISSSHRMDSTDLESAGGKEKSHQTIEKLKDSLFEEREEVFLAVIPEEAVKTRKSKRNQN